ncbi:MAG: 16S rRNA (cytosine(1402)-N(4))-methyltransferase [Rickettsiales bacterium]|nr:16S rRNA (cytosine(1402)-N(4))-methyltransferase [Rickettsiales bacterium]OUV78998.1 MAG: 16S rRNA (cytosine(1402)-N(4))-methyltransferase [Rickettsiales bacterium TMED131]
MLATKHIPVMMDKAIDALNVRDDLNYIDVTFGMGGYSEAILEKAKCNLLALDKDSYVSGFAKKIKNKYKKRFSFINKDFNSLDNILERRKSISINGGIVADLGVSSMQIDDEKRGFSFMRDGPLDMRMNCRGMSAKDLISNADEKELSKILWEYGEEKQSRAIARLIVKERELYAIDSTFKLVKIIKKAKKNYYKKKTHPATQTFQAIRIYINKELESLAGLLKLSENILLPGARLVIITFHSLEDRMVKIFFNKLSGKQSNLNRHLPQLKINKTIKFKALSNKPINPSVEEINENNRARSAKLRAVERIVI